MRAGDRRSPGQNLLQLPPGLSLLVGMGMLSPAAQEFTQSPGRLGAAQLLPPRRALRVQIAF